MTSTVNNHKKKVRDTMPCVSRYKVESEKHQNIINFGSQVRSDTDYARPINVLSESNIRIKCSKCQ